ncbi:dihydrolipoyl dehydrogenase family protein [Tropicimonas isoalkanivorans]|uniref:Pyruvate/2-oxoglutarate dehydrogenase complex, dihydrolipoamide dehydrogenase (E3) component n=1 Tax=Tropicimonas isoalkanivorans TaxID=441112 RepID=A0A1I1RB06_9RHOB|nr:FAD-dependent oxidoreductase [Tropicimonas isoalkanivorans]SFD31317.1 Pyruvate/2-oxoglutarate dehydrogenase complex, dihydrolipoamide dehydrogenase (E3) component [Tropicimonas isoalkanivorans]
MEDIQTDVCIIGAGSAGLSLAAGAVQMGAKVVLIEAGEMGGECLNVGCVPSKALIAAAKQAQALRYGASLGIAPIEPEVDFAAVMKHVHGAIAAIAPHDSQDRFEGLGVRVIRERAAFTAPDRLEAGPHRISARRFVIATGSRPAVPPIPGLEEVPFLTNESLFDLTELPEHLLIIGGGPIGLEMAQAFRRLGARVTVIEADAAHGREDPELAAIVLKRLRKEGVEIVEGAVVERVSQQDGAISVETGNGTHAGSHLLVATGRVPTTDGLGLDAAEVEHDKKGITVDDRLRTSNRKIYAMGDVAGQGQFTHLAGYHAGVLGRTIPFGLPAKAKNGHIPRATYTDPELAHVGLSEAEARKQHGDALEVIRVPYTQSDRAIAEGQTTGLVKVMVHRGRPVGVGIVGHQAGDLIGTWALFLANGLKMKALSDTVLPYPTLSELNKRAAGAYFSPRLFENIWVKRVVGFVQRHVP